MNSQVSQPLPDAGAANAYDPSAEPAGLGVRTVGSDSLTGELHDVLRLTSDLGRPAIVEMLVRERATLFSRAQLPGLSDVVRVQRASSDGRVDVWSRRAEGFRLSAVLEWTEARGVASSLDAALTIGHRLLAALESLQSVDSASGASGHGAIAVDQVVVDEAGKLTLTDHAFGTALASLQWPRERLWRRFRIAMPPAAGLARFDHRVDVTQAAVVMCAILTGRLFKADEYPRQLEALVAEAVRRTCGGASREERQRLTVWLRAATELEARNAFPSAAAARYALCHAAGARLENTDAVRRWLRDARGIPEPEPAANEVAASSAAPVAMGETPRASDPAAPLVSRLRHWISAK
ncbi:MAG: hypothetical protein WD690_05040 [Vicinamibacterales bacterium]